MVRSKGSCFKILACGSDSVEKDEFELDESKGSMDKRGWSFRKRSARHRVLSNTVNSETLSTQNKESPESNIIEFHTRNNTITTDKISTLQSVDETPPLSVAIDSKEPSSMVINESNSKDDLLITTECNNKVDSVPATEDTSDVVNHKIGESVIIIIQAAVRGYLARRALLKIKSVVKLQAVVRGHLVRRQAIGTLRCVQAIVKIQALVRARRSRMSLQSSISVEKLDEKTTKTNQHRKPMGKENLGTEGNRNYSSTEKLLGNSFARQLLESTPKRKQIHIKCNPSKPDSSWKWLERWMSASASDSVQPQKQPPSDCREQVQIDTTSELQNNIPVERPDSADLTPDVTDIDIPLEGEENLITYDAGNFNFHASKPKSSESTDDIQQSQHDDVGFNVLDETSSTADASQMSIKSEAPSAIPCKSEIETERPNHSMKRLAPEEPDTGLKKFAFGTRKAFSPAFAAVQSKFEELSSPTPSIRSASSSTGQEVSVESKRDDHTSQADSVARTKDLTPTESSLSPEGRIHIAVSECETELSISPTLDSPNASEDGIGDSKHEAVTDNAGSPPIETTDNTFDDAKMSIGSNIEVTAPDSQAYSATPVKIEDTEEESSEVVLDTTQVEQQAEKNTSEVHNLVGSPLDKQTYKSSPEGSPRSHITVSESHGTPSSYVSTNAKRSNSDKKKHSHKRKSLPSGKQSPSNHNHDSGARSSTEQLPKELKNGKRRNSFGSTKADNVEQEPSDSSSNSLPSYMQATESARAKAHSNSPRSSPDVQDKEFYVKKRHSLPGANGKQVSPRMQRSMSQAQPNVKGNSSVTHERKWQR
ncbi:hypothetical protein Sjap_010063 [Stephania japonica]|uniref:DUF4005 domain-containing protein n=1 Tax=Stephania japonica TaxID=461633 RepID=A0AAP0J8S7_9MAGN